MTRDAWRGVGWWARFVCGSCYLLAGLGIRMIVSVRPVSFCIEPPGNHRESGFRPFLAEFSEVGGFPPHAGPGEG